MSYVIREDFITLKKLYEEGNIDKFEKKISNYSAGELYEFAAYFSLIRISNNEYYNVKVISEISYYILLKVKYNKSDKFVILALKHLGRCVYLSSEKKLWNDVIKYGLLIFEFTLEEDEKITILDYLSLAYFYQGNYGKELYYREKLLDDSDFLSLYNYALALFHNQKYEEARFYNQRCLEKCEFPPALRNQAHICVLLEDDYIKAYGFCEKALKAYYKNEDEYSLVNPIIYLLQELFICALCSSDKLHSELLLHKEEFERGIKNNYRLSNNIHMIYFIEACSFSNRGIYYFEQMEFNESIELFNKALTKIYSEMERLDKSLIIVDFYYKLKGIIEFYILLIKIIHSFKLLFDEYNIYNDWEEKFVKIQELKNILEKVSDEDYIYEYKKVIHLFLNYQIVIMRYILKNEIGEVEQMGIYISQLKIRKSNFIMNNLLSCLYELNKLAKDYKDNTGLAFFESDSRKKYINEIKKICDNFCTSMRKVTASLSMNNNGAIGSSSELCEHIIRAIFQMKKYKPSYVKNYILNNELPLKEEDFRDTLGYFFSSIYDITSEGWRKGGRTDLIINCGNDIQKVIEFKIWGRNDYKEVVQQIVERYLTEFDDVGYIFMVNSNKNPILEKYIEFIMDSGNGYILNSLRRRNIKNFEYLVTRHRTKFSEYEIYHFILNIFE